MGQVITSAMQGNKKVSEGAKPKTCLVVAEGVHPQKISLRLDTLQTLNVFQRFVGDINWIRPSLKIIVVAILQALLCSAVWLHSSWNSPLQIK